MECKTIRPQKFMKQNVIKSTKSQMSLVLYILVDVAFDVRVYYKFI